MIEDLLPGFKAHANIAHSLDDLLCTEFLESSVEMIESRYKLSIYRREMCEAVSVEDGLVRPSFRPDGRLVNVEGYGNAMLGDDYAVELPRSALGRAHAVIRYSCGYESAKQVPASLRQAIFKVALHLMEHRGDAVNRQNFAATAASVLRLGDVIKDSGAESILSTYSKVAM